MKSIFRSPLFGVFAWLALATALVASTYLVSRTWLSISSANVITVTGSARKSVTSDLAIWRGTFSVEHPELLEAQRRLKVDRSKVEVFLNARQIEPFAIQPIQISELRSRGNDQENREVAYRLTFELRRSALSRIPHAIGGPHRGSGLFAGADDNRLI